MTPAHRTDARDAAARPAAAIPLALIAAVAANGVIGDRNRLPWRLPADLKRFRTLTSGHAVIMGRKTWESLTGALPGRQNIVVTRNRDYAAPGAELAATLDEALALVRMPPPAFCIGGGELYRMALPRAATLYLTEIHRDFAGDATFPPFDAGEWRESARERFPGDGTDALAFDFVEHTRRDSPPR